MFALIKYLFLTVMLAACTTTEEKTRYRDTSALEQPPTLMSSKTPPADNSSIPEKQKPGLHDLVSLSENSPPVLTLKQSFDLAWHSVNRALELREIKITDHERSRGHIYVSYEPKNIFQHMASWFSEPKQHPIYLLSLHGSDDKSSITAERARSSEQNPGAEAQPQESDASEELLTTLYQTIRDDLVEE
jgi:hypothetical protein